MAASDWTPGPAPKASTPDYRALATAEATRQGVDPSLVARLITQESAFDPQALSPKGAVGLMQLMPDTAKELGVDPSDPGQNIKGGVTYLKSLLTRYQGDTRKAVAAYNAGPGAVDKYGDVPPFQETQNYVKKVVGETPDSRWQAGSAADWTKGPAPASKAPTAPQTPSAADAFLQAAGMGIPASVQRGVAKGVARTALIPGEIMRRIPGVSSAVDALYGRPGITEAGFKAAHEATTAKGTGELVGKGLEAAAEFAFPVGKGVKAVEGVIPTTAKAAAKFQDVMSVARNIPVNLGEAGNVALRIDQLAEHGGQLPGPVRKFIAYATNPKKPPMTYEVGRDFASNVSKLSATEMMHLNDATKYHVAELRVALNKANAEAAALAGKGREYAQAMTEYGRAKKIKDAMAAAIAGAKKAAPWGLGAGIAGGVTYNLGKKLTDLWSGE